MSIVYPDSVTMTTLPGIPLVQQGDDLAALIVNALDAAALTLQPADVLVIASKIVSKAEGRRVDLRTVQPSAEAYVLATQSEKDPRIVELALRESVAVSRVSKHVLVMRHRLGFVSANAGIDQSNVGVDGDHVLLLPVDPDASAQALRDRLLAMTGVETGIIISDSHGRPFRMGNIGVAIGVAGLPALLDLRGQEDLFGRVLRASIIGYADLIASAAHLVCGEGGEGRPVTLVHGLHLAHSDGHAGELNRPPEQDLYR